MAIARKSAYLVLLLHQLELLSVRVLLYQVSRDDASSLMSGQDELCETTSQTGLGGRTVCREPVPD